MSDFDISSVPILFNMDIANAPTMGRFCDEAAAVLGETISDDDQAALDDDTSEFGDEIVDEWTDKLESAGYSVHWDAGDVVVFDLRGLTDDQREQFYQATENW